MNRYFMELIGTFFLVFVIGLVAIEPQAGILAPIAIGMTLAIMIFAGGHISGGHYNPAVTLAVALVGKIEPPHALIYILFQCIGATLAAGLIFLFKDMTNIVALEHNISQTLIAELLYTFILVFVILNVAIAQTSKNNFMLGFAVGIVIASGAITVGKISGAAFNPAVVLAISIMGLSAWGDIWIYLLANFIASFVGALCFVKMNPKIK